MKAGDHITVHSGKTFTDEATIETICHPDELPAIANAPNVEAVRKILAEESYVSVALISYKFLGETLAFVALQTPAENGPTSRARHFSSNHAPRKTSSTAC